MHQCRGRRAIALAAGVFALLASDARRCAAQQPARDSPTSPGGADAPARAPRKSAGAAAVLGVLHPGLGQHYAGEHRRGFLIQAGTYAALGTALAFDAHALRTSLDGCLLASTSCATTARRASQDLAATVGFGLAGFGIWLYGAVDAPHAARRVNERRANGWSQRLVPMPALGLTPSGAVYAGASLRVR